MTRDEMFTKLSTKLCRVVFVKKDGEERDMVCTRQIDRVPEELRPKGTGRPEPENTIRVFVPQAEGWRSINVDTVKLFEVIA